MRLPVTDSRYMEAPSTQVPARREDRTPPGWVALPGEDDSKPHQMAVGMFSPDEGQRRDRTVRRSTVSVKERRQHPVSAGVCHERCTHRRSQGHGRFDRQIQSADLSQDRHLIESSFKGDRWPNADIAIADLSAWRRALIRGEQYL